MKRIIYSLVLMFAVGGFFTSCIENVEPQGVLAMREAQAEYLKACAKLQEAKVAVETANAARELAAAEVQKANAEQIRVATEMAKLAAEIQNRKNELANEKEAVELDKLIAKWEMELDSLSLEHQAYMANLEGKVALANETLENTLKAIEIRSLGLSDAERTAIDTVKAQYIFWLGKHTAALDAYVADYAKYTAINTDSYKAYQGAIKDSVAREINNLKRENSQLERKIKFWSDVHDSDVAAWADSIEVLKDEANSYIVKIAQAKADSAYFFQVEKAEIEKPYQDSIDAINEQIKALGTEGKDYMAEPAKVKGTKAYKKTIKISEFTDASSVLYSFLAPYFNPANNGLMNLTSNGTDKHIVADTVFGTFASMDSILGTGAFATKYYTDASGLQVTGLDRIVAEVERAYRFDNLDEMTEEQKEAYTKAVAATVAKLDSTYEAVSPIVKAGVPSTYKTVDGWIAAAKKEKQGDYVEALAALKEVKKRFPGESTDSVLLSVTTAGGYSGETSSVGTGSSARGGLGVARTVATGKTDSTLVINEIIAAYKKVGEAGVKLPQHFFVSSNELSQNILDSVDMANLNSEGFKKIATTDANASTIPVNFFSRYDGRGYEVYYDSTSGVKAYTKNYTTALATATVSKYQDIFSLIGARIQDDIDSVQSMIDNSYDGLIASNYKNYKLDKGGAVAKALYEYLNACETYYGDTLIFATPAKANADGKKFFNMETLPELIYFDVLRVSEDGKGFVKVDTSKTKLTYNYTQVVKDLNWYSATDSIVAFEKTLPFQVYQMKQVGKASSVTAEAWKEFKDAVASVGKEFKKDVEYNATGYAEDLEKYKADEKAQAKIQYNKDIKAIAGRQSAAVTAASKELTDAIDNLEKAQKELNDLANALESAYSQIKDENGAIIAGSLSAVLSGIEVNIKADEAKLIANLKSLAEMESKLESASNEELLEMLKTSYEEKLEKLQAEVDYAEMWVEYYAELLATLLVKYM